MAERTDLIEQHIELTRYQLGNNLHELEDKVKQAADWKTYYERNPMMMVGLAFGGGVLLASMMGSKRGRQDTPFTAQTPRSAGYLPGATQRNPLSDTWQDIKAALIGLSGAKIRSLLDEAIPGFSEHYANATRGNSGSSATSTYPGNREYETPTHRM
jgi:hypothetical protein